MSSKGLNNLPGKVPARTAGQRRTQPCGGVQASAGGADGRSVCAGRATTKTPPPGVVGRSQESILGCWTTVLLSFRAKFVTSTRRQRENHLTPRSLCSRKPSADTARLGWTDAFEFCHKLHERSAESLYLHFINATGREGRK